MRTSKGVIERPVQHLYPLEMIGPVTQQLNPHAQTYRPKRKAAAVAAAKIKNIAENEERD